MTLTYGELPHLTGSNISPRPVLYCDSCESRFSANNGDYFLMVPDTICKCANCGFALRIVTTSLVITDYKLENKG